MTITVLPIKKRKSLIKTFKCSITRVAAPFRIRKALNKEDQNRKKEVVEDKFKIGLHVMIYRAEGIDKPKDYPNIENRDYNVVYWIKPGEEIVTKVSKGFIPEWNQGEIIGLDSLDDHVFLNVEVQRCNSSSDPGTSSGKIVVGRAKVPLGLAFNRRKIGAFPLLRSDGNEHRLEGKILLSMRLQRFKDDDSIPLQCYSDDLNYDDVRH